MVGQDGPPPEEDCVLHPERFSPPLQAIVQAGEPDGPALAREGAAAARVLGAALGGHAPDLVRQGGRVLDFGAGTGAVARALAPAMALPTDACDISEEAMADLAHALPQVRSTGHGITPPLAFADATFDAVYAVSAWGGLPPSAGRAWLQELKRILKPGGLALIAVCGPDGVARRRLAAGPGWSALEAGDLDRLGILYLPRESGPQSGIPGPFGFAAYSHGAILEAFDAALRVEAIYAGVFPDGLDLVVLRRPLPPQSAPLRKTLRDGAGGAQRLWRRLAGGRKTGG